MSGILDGVRVLDVSRGIAGPMTAMLLADHGADVVRVEPHGGDGYGDRPGSVVWNRGRRRLELDLAGADDRASFLDLASRADVLLETFRPGVTARLGIDFDAVHPINDRLVYASITGYGRDTADAMRPGIEWLVTARTGLQWDQRAGTARGWTTSWAPTSTEPGFAVPAGVEQTGCREGPIFLAVPWASIGAALLADDGDQCRRLRRRPDRSRPARRDVARPVLHHDERHGVAAGRPDSPQLPPVVLRSAGAEGHLPGRRRPLAAPVGPDRARLPAGERSRCRHAGRRASPAGPPAAGDYEALVRAQAPRTSTRRERSPAGPLDEWIARCWEANIAMQPILSPEEGLLDQPLEDEGVIVELEDPVHGRIRQVGHVYAFDGVANPPIRPARPRWAMPRTCTRRGRAASPSPTGEQVAVPAAPLAGVLVLDLGLAIAGPFGPQMLADLGATVIKVTTRDFDLTDAIYVGSSHGKLALALDLKHPRGREVAHRLIARADVVHHNMRTGVAERLGIGYEDAQGRSTRASSTATPAGSSATGRAPPCRATTRWATPSPAARTKPGARTTAPRRSGRCSAFGDTGNGIISAAAVIQALRHRDRTGEGQFVHTSILNVCMLFNSYTFARPDGTGPDRDRIDAGQHGFSALQRLYETADGWLCVFVGMTAQWAALCGALDAPGSPATSALRRCGGPAGRATMRSPRSLVRSSHGTGATHWAAALDAAGVPCEIASSTYAASCSTTPTCTAAAGSSPAPTSTSARSSTSACRSRSRPRRR